MRRNRSFTALNYCSPMVTQSFALKALFGAIIFGALIGTAIRLFESGQIMPSPAREDSWTPTRNTIGTVQSMSAVELDAQQPNTMSFGRAAPTLRTDASSGENGWSYGNCREVRAVGAAPLRRGQPGYGPHLDGDGDGVACEPYYGR